MPREEVLPVLWVHLISLFPPDPNFKHCLVNGLIKHFSGIDSSLPAVELARENVILNHMDPEKVVFYKQDSTEFMKGALSREETWDIVILDPPKLAPRKKVTKSCAFVSQNMVDVKNFLL